MPSELRHVTFKNSIIEIAADLHLPAGFVESENYAAVVITTPGSSVKEQIGSNYARRLAERGYVALAFDPSYQGESGGMPRDLEDPATRVEDVRCAVDYLMTLPYIGEGRVGVLGICAGGGYAIEAAKTEHRLKAVATVVAVNLGRAFRQAEKSPDAVSKTLQAVGKQRTLEARGGEPRRDNWIPDTPEDAKAADIKDPGTLEAVDFYRTPRGYNKNSTNRLYFRSAGLLLGFDAFHLVSELLTQPLQVIVAGRLGTTFSFEDGKTLFERAPNKKGFFVVEGAGHYEMYDKPQYVNQAIDCLDDFYRQYPG